VDHSKANGFYQKAVDGGDALGMAGLGKNLLEGAGIKQDVAAGLALMEKAVGLGNPKADFNLAVAYGDGKFVKSDFAKSAKYYLAALEGGDSAAHDKLIKQQAAKLSPQLIDQLQKALQAKGKTFEVKKGKLSKSAIAALQSVYSAGSE
jgi:TPR repeat protein